MTALSKFFISMSLLLLFFLYPGSAGSFYNISLIIELTHHQMKVVPIEKPSDLLEPELDLLIYDSRQIKSWSSRISSTLLWAMESLQHHRNLNMATKYVTEKHSSPTGSLSMRICAPGDQCH